MAGFKFERNLPHQIDAVASILKVFEGVEAKQEKNKMMANIANPILPLINMSQYRINLEKVQGENAIEAKYRDKKSNILDISMETGTGKTYTYTKMMFELNKNLGLSKFIVIVPTLSIKAGTINFLKAKATREHFREEYKCEIKTYLVESKKGKKSKKSTMPQAVREFVEARAIKKDEIHIMIINAGMINSDTMAKEDYDTLLFDKYSNPFEAIGAMNPFTIIDEPHKFATLNKTWKNIEKFHSQFIVRYGATFNGDFKNLIYKLSAVDAFNSDLVKGVIAYVEEFENNQKSFVKLKSTDGIEATFELNMNGTITKHKLLKKDSMSIIHKEMHDLKIENLNKSIVVLSNGLEINKESVINPYSYSQSLQDKMMEKSIAKHFELEKTYLTQEPRIKPLTLFFIDDIAGYRDAKGISGSLKTKFETIATSHIKRLLKEEITPFYRAYLEKSLEDVSLIHGGYFSKDNSDKDDKIEKEINDILHDKEALLSLENTRRFIFSKWTLREGWDNPNVFQICKLRSSGSVTSKLQEVGRGLRLPVNEFMARVTNQNHYLHYYVDFTEKDFVQSLVDEINQNSGTFNITITPPKLSDEMIEMILKHYPEFKSDGDRLLELLDENNMIKRNNEFKIDGFSKLLKMYPNAFNDGLKSNKITSGDNSSSKPQVSIRKGKYEELKTLWEAINSKVILEYKIENEEAFYTLLKGYFIDNLSCFKPQGVKTHTQELTIIDNLAGYKESESTSEAILAISTMQYKAFIEILCREINVNIRTLHRVFVEIYDRLNINLYLNIQTIRTIKEGFNQYLLSQSFGKFEIGYNKISNTVHPTKFTDKKGMPFESIDASDIGVHFTDTLNVAETYMFEELYYDSELEKENIAKNIDEVTVFTKIPKNSIKIPVAGGGTYSPDFAYIIKDKKGNRALNLIVETKGKDENALGREEMTKIKHAEALFSNLDSSVKVTFKSQFKNDKMVEIIEGILNGAEFNPQVQPHLSGIFKF